MKLGGNPGTVRRRSLRGAFTMWDLLALLVVAAGLGVFYAFEHTGERGRIARCTGNLKMLGEATQAYANDHNDALPPAAIDLGAGITSWDMDLSPYLLKPGAPKPKSIYEKTLIVPAAEARLACPSDPFKRANPRSYATSERNMNPGWPPGPEDKAGLGILWNAKTVAVLGGDIAESAKKNPDLLPGIKRSMLPDPAHTLWLTELIMPENHLRHSGWAKVGGIQQQEEYFDGDSSSFHFGKFNYLMADGRVELLPGTQTDGSDGKHHNIWTIDAKD